jgi:hypothetical protein
MKHSMYGRSTRAILAALVLAAASAHAQAVQQQSTSVVDDLLTRATNSLNDLQYTQALTFAKQVLDLGDRVPGDKRERAMFIVAAANYPEGEPSAQHRSVALATFKQMVRSKLDLTIPQAMRWAGLDSILAEAKATTFGLAGSPASAEQEGVGPTGHVDFNARASRPARFRLTVTGPSIPTVIEDTTAQTQATLQLPTMRNDRPIFTTGEYQIVLTATDMATGDTVSARFVANVNAPALTFATVPVAMDSSRFLSERTKRYGWKGIVVGGLVAGSIFGFSSAMHADTTLKAKAGADSKGAGVALLAGATVILASYLDKGRPIPTAIAANLKIREDFAGSIRAAQAENANRIATHKTTFSITAGAR